MPACRNGRSYTMPRVLDGTTIAQRLMPRRIATRQYRARQRNGFTAKALFPSPRSYDDFLLLFKSAVTRLHAHAGPHIGLVAPQMLLPCLCQQSLARHDAGAGLRRALVSRRAFTGWPRRHERQYFGRVMTAQADDYFCPKHSIVPFIAIHRAI